MLEQTKFEHTTSVGNTYQVEASWRDSERGVCWVVLIQKHGNLVGGQHGLLIEGGNLNIANIVAKQVKANLDKGIVSM